MKLYHFTSPRHLYGISSYGLTVGDVPTDLSRFKGRCGVWLTSASGSGGHGLEGSAADKCRFRLTVEAPDNALLVRWVDWASKYVTADTLRCLHATAANFDTWYVYFGVIARSAILECVDMESGTVVDWTGRQPSPVDTPPVPPWRREFWHRKMIKDVKRALKK